jgi:hypothetical protein
MFDLPTNNRVIPMRITTLLLCCVLLSSRLTLAQSTSQPILIESEAGDCAPSQGTCYLTMTFKGGSIYQHANWYTNFIGKNKQGNLTISITAGLETGSSVSDTKASDPVTLTKNGNDVSLSYEGPIAMLLPLTFSQISFDVKINQTVKDGLNDLLTLFAQQSATVAPLSATTLGYVSAGKAIADFLFNPALTQSRAVGHFSFSPSTAPAPGYYVVLAGQDNADWNRFTTDLKRLPGGLLGSSAGSVAGITYYVYEVQYVNHRYKDLNAALSFKKSKPWASLYLSALTSAKSGWTLDQHDTTETSLRKQLDDAQTLLVSDADITAEESLAIIQEASDAVNKSYQERYKALVAAASPQPGAVVLTVGNKSVPTNPTILSIPHDEIEHAVQQLTTLHAAAVLAQ